MKTPAKSPRKPPAKAGPAPLTHFDGAGQAHMVDVGAKAETTRVARAQGHIRMAPATFALLQAGLAKKGSLVADSAVPPAGADARRRRVRSG